jgi:hypothetical protein
MESFGFIITRHVNSENTNKYWNHSVKLLRTLYPYKRIIIIDDNSNQQFLKSEFDYNNIQVIQSEFHGRGELLPYYYYIKNKFFENAVIIHDSIFFHKRINFEVLNGVDVLPLWFFESDKENIDNTIRITKSLKNSYPIEQKLLLNDTMSMPQLKWYGCFGVQSYINHNFLLRIEEKYKITNLVKVINCRQDRCCLERIFGAIFFNDSPPILKKKAIFGNIMKYQKWGGCSFDEYIDNIKKGNIPKFVIKVWTGR